MSLLLLLTENTPLAFPYPNLISPFPERLSILLTGQSTTHSDELVPGGRAPLIIHTRTCNDRSKPTATVSGDEYVCPSQVEVVIRG